MSGNYRKEIASEELPKRASGMGMAVGGGGPPPPEWDQILSASQKNNDSEIRRLVTQEGVSPSHANAVGQSALHIASLWGNVDAVRALLEHSANANATNRITGATPLHCAVQSSKKPVSNRIECARLLLSAGADPNLGDAYGTAPIDYLDEDDGEVSCMREVLLSSQGTVGVELFNLIGQYDIGGVREYVAREGTAAVEERDGRMGLTPLLHTVNRMLTLGGDECADDESQRMEELRHGEDLVVIAKTLLENGADPNAVPRGKRTPSQRRLGHLPEETPNFDQAADEGDDYGVEAPLHMVCVALNAAYASRGAASSSDDDAAVSFHITRVTYLEEAATLLHGHGAEVTTPTILLLHDASRRDNLPMAVFLVNVLGVNPNVRGRQGMTALHFAARSGRVDVVRFLLSCGDDAGSGGRGGLKDDGEGVSAKKSVPKLDVTIADDRGKTALDAALVNEKHEVVALLEGYTSNS